MKKLFTKTVVAEAVMLAILASSILPTVMAAELNLPTDPLITSSSVEPNLMILIDTSGSMSNIVPDIPYDEEVDYYNCTSNELSNNRQIDIRIKSNGNVYFKTNQNYDFGQGSNLGTNDYNQKCFDDDTIYTARLLGDSGGSPSSYLASEYTGNYLNWYFSNSTHTASDNFGTNADRKPGTQTRMEIAKASAATMVDDLVGMRVGLATYNGSSGAKIQKNIKSIETSTDITTLKNAINTITNGGSTPLGESLADLGRYFAQRANGVVSEQLTLHPDNIGINKTEKNVDMSSFFSHAPSNSSPPTTDVITNWCQESFIVAMTDGIPTSDTSVSNDLKNYRRCNSSDV